MTWTNNISINDSSTLSAYLQNGFARWRYKLYFSDCRDCVQEGVIFLLTNYHYMVFIFYMITVLYLYFRLLVTGKNNCTYILGIILLQCLKVAVRATTETSDSSQERQRQKTETRDTRRETARRSLPQTSIVSCRAQKHVCVVCKN